MNEYSLTVFLFMVPREKKDNAYANFFFWGGGGRGRGGLGKQGLLWEMCKWRISFNITGSRTGKYKV